MKKALVSALVIFAVTAQLAGCNAKTPSEQSSESSSVVSEISSVPQSSSTLTSSTTSSTTQSSVPQSSSTTTSSAQESKPQSSSATAVSSVAETSVASAESNSPAEEKPQPQWTEQSITQTTYYVNSDYVNSREKAIQGSTIVKQYRLNDVVTVIATTNTGYMKLDNGSFIHVDYLSKNKIEEVQKPSNTNTGSTNTGSTNTGSSSTGTATTVKPIPYTGKLIEPEEGVTKLSEETIVNVMNQQVPVYKVQTETGVYWYKPSNGTYFPTKEDAIKSTNKVPSWKVLPSKYKEGDITGIELH